MFSAWRPIALALPLIALLAIIVLFFGIRDDPSSQKVAARLSDTHDVRLTRRRSAGHARAAVRLRRGEADPARRVAACLRDQCMEARSIPTPEPGDQPRGRRDPVASGSEGSLTASAFGTPATGAVTSAQTGVDDVAYLRALIEEAETIVAIDRVAVVGHSNGGFMAWRLACEGVPKLVAIASITSIAGAATAEPPECEGASPVSALHLHVGADEDELVRLRRRRMARTTTPPLSKRCDAGPHAPGVTSTPR